jgi:choline dehydrogenase
MQYIRGHRTHFDGWAAEGNAGTTRACCRTFVDLEDYEGGASAYHGVGGPLHVSLLRDKNPNPVSTAFVEACVERSHPAKDDINGPTLKGAGWNPTSIKDRVRQDTWTCFLAPVVGRPNLAVRAGAHVARLLVTGDRVTGVELVGGVQIVAGHEVVVCAGAIDSSWLLLQSGIGPADELRELGVDVMVDKE